MDLGFISLLPVAFFAAETTFLVVLDCFGFLIAFFFVRGSDFGFVFFFGVEADLDTT